MREDRQENAIQELEGALSLKFTVWLGDIAYIHNHSLKIQNSIKVILTSTKSSGTKWECGKGCGWELGLSTCPLKLSHLFPLAQGPSVSRLGTWRPVHLPLCCLASVWFGVCLTSTLLQNGYFSSAETTPCCHFCPALPQRSQGPVSTTSQWAGLDRRCFVF